MGIPSNVQIPEIPGPAATASLAAAIIAGELSTPWIRPVPDSLDRVWAIWILSTPSIYK